MDLINSLDSNVIDIFETISISASYCPALPTSVSSGEPFNGEVILEQPGVEYTGECLGLHNEEGDFDTPKSCDRIGARVHRLYTNISDGTGYYWMQIDVRVNQSSFGLDTVYFNATFAQDVLYMAGDATRFTYDSADQGGN